MGQDFSDSIPRMEPLLASLLKMLTRYMHDPQPGLAHMIKKQLAYVSNHPESAQFPLIKVVTEKLHDDWATNASSNEILVCEYTKNLH
jgi:hypothetical protein